MKQNRIQLEKSARLNRRRFLEQGLIVSAAALAGVSRWRLRDGRAASPVVPRSRVAWIHDAAATSWEGEGYYGDHVDQDRVTRMVDDGIKALTGQASRTAAWRRIIPDYVPGKKIGIKMVTTRSIPPCRPAETTRTDASMNIDLPLLTGEHMSGPPSSLTQAI